MVKHIGHAILCVTTILTIHENPSLSWMSITLEILLLHGLLGLSEFFTNELQNIFQFTTDVVQTLPLAFINTQFLLPVNETIGYLHAVSAIAPLLLSLIQRDNLDEERIKNIVIYANVGSAIYLSIELKNLWFIVLALITLMNRFALDKPAEKLRITSTQALSIGLALFCIVLTLCMQAL